MEKGHYQYFLVSDHFETIMLSETSLLSFGRARENSMTLNNLAVSRHHALVLYDDGHFLVQDRGSRNGTFVNGERVASAVLRCGDEVKLGSVVFHVHCVAKNLDVSDSLGGDTVSKLATLDVAGEVANVLDSDFGGDFGSVTMAELAQLMSYNLKTGVLILWARGARDHVGKLFFESGKLVHAEHGSSTGMSAAMLNLIVDQGRFEFKIGVQPPQISLTKPTEWLLFEAYRRRDEILKP